MERYKIREGVERIAEGNITAQIPTEELHGEDKKLAEAINNIGSGLVHAVDDNTRNERMKADLITNVSHDIKTPLTSIINYVNLIKMEQIDNERVEGYIRILDEKSQRLKQLTEDLVEASRVSSGNIELDMRRIDIVELVYQTAGEFNEKFEKKNLTIVTKLPQGEVPILADGRRLYRVIENLYNNVAKYALEKTRVYVEVMTEEETVQFSIKNVSEKSLAAENSQVEDLTERFIRGDSSRTTEGSGLGLSIAKNLTTLMGGGFDISVDGDLFKATILFPAYKEEQEQGADDNAALDF
jgi:signal transduction histidine kinase